MKTCPVCRLSKDASEFGVNGSSYDGLQSYCKVCAKEKRDLKRKTLREQDKECGICHQIKSYDQFQKKKAFKEDIWKCRFCRETLREEYGKEFRESRKEELNEYCREYRKTHKVNRSIESKERSKQSMRERYRNDPEYRERIKEKVRQRRREGKVKVVYTPRAELDPEKLKKAREYHNQYYQNQRKTPQYRNKLKEKKEVNPSYFEKRRNNFRCKRLGIEGEVDGAHLQHLYRWQERYCYFCNVKLSSADSQESSAITIEHLIPVDKEIGGTNNNYNIVRTCRKCNFSRQRKLFFKDWLPKEVERPRDHFLSPYTKDVRKFLEENGLNSHCEDAVILSSFWGSERYNSDKYFLQKMKEETPSRLFFWDFEWEEKSPVIKNMLMAKFGNTVSIGARQYTVYGMDAEDAGDFLNQYHLKGSSVGSVNLALVDSENTIGAVATFKEFNDRWELARLAFKDRIQGGTSKLMNHFMENFSNGKPLYTFVDPRHGGGLSYLKSGFVELPDTESVSYGYISPTGFVSRHLMMKHRMSERLDWFDETLSEQENARINGWFRLFSLKQKKYVRQ